MTDRDGGPGRKLVLVAGLSPADVALVHREALRVLRPGMDAAHLDAYSDGPWPAAVLPSLESALSLAREAVTAGRRSRRDDPGMGIGIDVRDDAQFEVLVDLAPHTIHAEGSRQGRPVFSAGDSGTSLWTALSPEQEAQLLNRLDALGIPSTVLAVRRPGG